jgi:signal transduction histidine kinase
MRPANDVLRGLEGSNDGSPAAPAFIIDAVAGAIVAANAAGWEAWGLDAACLSTAAIDRAMPALQRLAQIACSGGDEALIFWTARGLLELQCRVEPVGRGSYLVRAPAGRPKAQAQALEGAPFASPRPGAVAGTSVAARLAHELRTPLSAVIAYAEVLKDEHFGPLAPRYRDYARTIHDSARHALCVVDGMLASNPARAGLPELAFRDLDPAGMIENCLAVAGPLAERAGLELVAHLGPGTPHIVADEVSLKQMLLNLITNAIKFGRPGDRVTVGTAYDVAGVLRISVADTGPGIGPTAQRDAAPADSRKGGHQTGLGIGLPLTRALAEANGARLIIDSAPGQGTRVTIAFGKDRVVPV